MKKKVPQHLKGKLAALKDISLWMVIDESGNISYTDIRKGIAFDPIHLGVHVKDIAFMTLNKPIQKAKNVHDLNIKAVIHPKTKYLLRMPSHIIVAGKGVHIWDLHEKKRLRTLSYNSYAYYLAVAGCEVNEADGSRSLIVAIGTLHDQINSFGDDVFIEIWNPVTGGCVKRITQTNLSFSYGVNYSDSYFLRVFPEEPKNDTAHRGSVCLINTGMSFEMWDLFNEKRLSELTFNEGHKLSVESLFGEGKTKFLLIDHNSMFNAIETYESSN